MRTCPFPSFIDDYLNHLLVKGRKQSTITRYTYDLGDFAQWLYKVKGRKDVDWKSITKEELELFFEELADVRYYHVRTIRRIHSVLKQVARFQQAQGKSELRPIIEMEPPELIATPLSNSEWLTRAEQSRLLNTLRSTVGLSDQQLETFHFYRQRNELIVRLFLFYGLTLRECYHLSMFDIRFERNELHIHTENHEVRIISLDEEDKQLAYDYYKRIPEPVRPRYHSDDPFFVAFDFKRKTFHWSYEDDSPKRMTIIAIQKMLRMEVRRAQLRKGISAQTLRHTFVLTKLINGMSSEEVISLIGYTSPLSLKRYLSTVGSLNEEARKQFLKTAL